MGEKLVIGPIGNGLQLNKNAFNIDNDAFPQLINAYQWRGRVKRKRGTELVGRLQRHFDSLNSSYSSFTDIAFAAGNANLLTQYLLQVNGSIIPKTVTIKDATVPETYTDTNGDGNLFNSSNVLSGTINYGTSAVSIAAVGNHAATAIFDYYPSLPVMGLEDFIPAPTQFPGTLGFDTTYSYNITTKQPYTIYDVSFYKNTASPNTAKEFSTPTSWNGKDYQQFWTVNYQGALWATNGIDINPTTLNNIGMQYAQSADINYVSNTADSITVTINNSPLIVGDWVYLNEWTATTPGNELFLNELTGYVKSSSSTSTNPSLRTVEIKFDHTGFSMTIPVEKYNSGIIQYLTNRSDLTVDCIRWYDGDPTTAPNNVPPIVSGPTQPTGLGWVNFMPPLSMDNFTIADLPPAIYYLVGCRVILPYKDRLLFMGVVVQNASGNKFYLQDVVVYSQNGTPYYTATFNADPSLATTQFNAMLVPDNQTATPGAYWSDQTGFGGFLQAGIDQPIVSSAPNEDVLIVGFSQTQTRLVYSGNDLIPFSFYLINSEFGTSSTFSTVIMDKGIITRGNRSFTVTTQTNADRFDLFIPDNVFQMGLRDNGAERVCSQRDYENEWIYFTYPNNQVPYVFPTQTLLYNYRDNSWAIFNESYTTYGQFRPSEGYTWATLPKDLTWKSWNTPWNSYAQTLLQPLVVAGNQQGFVLIRSNQDTTEAKSLSIQNIVTNTVTCPNHCLSNGDYIVISDCIGTIGSQVNGKIFSVYNPTTNTFQINGPPITGGTYVGGGLITRMYVPFIQTKQFPVSWGMARKTRLGPQMYLLSTTDLGQITLQIYLSQNASSPYNVGSIVPVTGPTPQNTGLIYSTVLYTCAETTNLGLTAANTNLQMITDPSKGTTSQSYIWHRVNTSLIGDTVQLAFTLSDAQMRDTSFSNQFEEISLHGMILDVSPSQLLA